MQYILLDTFPKHLLLSALDIHRKKFFWINSGEIEPHRDISKYLNFYKKIKNFLKK